MIEETRKRVWIYVMPAWHASHIMQTHSATISSTFTAVTITTTDTYYYGWNIYSISLSGGNQVDGLPPDFQFLQHAEGFCDHEVGRGRMNRSRRRTAEEREKKQKRRESFGAEEKPLET